MIYILLGQPKSIKKILSRPLHSKLKKIQGLFKEKWNSRTFQGLPLKFKDFSRLCEPCETSTLVKLFTLPYYFTCFCLLCSYFPNPLRFKLFPLNNHTASKNK